MGARRRLCCCALLLAVLAGQLLLMARLRGHRAPDDHTAASLASEFQPFPVLLRIHPSDLNPTRLILSSARGPATSVP
ncbi:hypothetical protein FJT64_009092 [Amphibalanus amphitrite]|uniref:Uncharacterized protein n=1 Tax=Amphibalanus amphitrite TaxID=1232801 RepID=A0A6A4VGA9_AMPAM|nr:hypothetical protein FJT64_009092 [Amphibalanus amphitrite]